MTYKPDPDLDLDPMSLPPGLSAMVDGELNDGETIVWIGRPRVGRMVLSALPLLLFGIPFTAFACFWIGGVASMEDKVGGPGGGFALFGIPFLLVGLGLLTSPIWSGYQASRTCYALTNRRAIVWEPTLWSGVQVRSYTAEALGSIVRNQRGDGSGDLIFEEIVSYGPRGRRSVTRRGFLAIGEVRAVEGLIRTTLLSKPGG